MTIEHLEPDLRLIRAPNPSAMTGTGTNSYIVGRDALCIIDPGPDDPKHMARICAAIEPWQTVAAILVTHSHKDHSALAPRLAQTLGAPVLAFGDSQSGRSELMQRLAGHGDTGGGEGVDTAFKPDQVLSDGAILTLGQDKLQAIWTPGHMANHLCFLWRGAAFTGDHVMGWSSSLVSPPDGDLGAFMRSLTRLQDRRPRCLYPGHGPMVGEPAARIAALREHRLLREAQILTELKSAPQTIPSLVSRIYTDTPLALHSAAARNVHAHLIDLWERSLVKTDGFPNLSARFRLAEPS